MIKASCGCGATFQVDAAGGASWKATEENSAFKLWVEEHKCVVPFSPRYNSRTRVNRKIAEARESRG